MRKKQHIFVWMTILTFDLNTHQSSELSASPENDGVIINFIDDWSKLLLMLKVNVKKYLRFDIFISMCVVAKVLSWVWVS